MNRIAVKGVSTQKKQVSDGSRRISDSKTFSKVSQKSLQRAESDDENRELSMKQKEKLEVERTDTYTKLRDEKEHEDSQKVKNVMPTTKNGKNGTKITKSIKPRVKAGNVVTSQKNRTSVKVISTTKKRTVSEKSITNKGANKSVLKNPKEELLKRERTTNLKDLSKKKSNDKSDERSNHMLKKEMSDESEIDVDDKENEYKNQGSNLSKSEPEKITVCDDIRTVNPEEEIITESVEWKCLSNVMDRMSGITGESVESQGKKKPKTILKTRTPGKKRTKESDDFEGRRSTNSDNSANTKAGGPKQLANTFKMPLTIPKRRKFNFLLSEKWRIKLPVTHKFLH
ncbi:uncharacterized protein LOC111051778 isoform X3 [Nilaparvata lugens]|uniref:uncharacterized protein LOC111051778 isoform X3 n=1 Tax=Nilaparvata lugens TaxID=108931 RepID=UPI00193CD32D|nr:uncharacterized protein LOC111051778 isoform X3 [Nilaparvata lugens]XP_039283359.1 uncharacterized protein LOC111051778 isoform X3 [Nilaparvata lugens]